MKTYLEKWVYNLSRGNWTNFPENFLHIWVKIHNNIEYY